MASLTSTAYAARNLIKYGGSGLVALALLWSIGITVAKSYKVAHPKYIPPTVRYGALPKIVFPDKEYSKKNFSFEFTNDEIPTFSDQARVYIIYRSTTKILALEEAKKVAEQFGFRSEPIEINEGIYQFRNTEQSTALTMNVLEGNFRLQYPYTEDKTIIDSVGIQSKDGAIDTAINFLESGNKYSDDLKDGEKRTSFWKVDGGTLKSVTAQSEANVVKVDFYRKKLEDKWEITSPQANESSVTLLIAKSRVVEANFKYANIDRESYSTYPIKTVSEAMEDLRNGNYWPSADVSSDGAVIREVKLAYFEPVTLTQYVQPIYIFKGDNNFIAFVAAVADKYIAK